MDSEVFYLVLRRIPRLSIDNKSVNKIIHIINDG